MEALREMRANNEVRHKHSIRHGAAARGHKERPVRDQKDLYRPTGDNDNEVRKAHRRRTRS
jgi:hypothetical protein